MAAAATVRRLEVRHVLMELRPYQQQARAAVQDEWKLGNTRTLLVLPTGCGKTTVFAKITEDCVRLGDRVLILAHRGELLDQAADKIKRSTGLTCATEKAEQSCLDSSSCWYRVTVGSVQSLMRESRLSRFKEDYFDTIIIDEAHHAVSDSYQRVLEHFHNAKVLGVTATPDRGDMRELGEESVAEHVKVLQQLRDAGLEACLVGEEFQKALGVMSGVSSAVPGPSSVMPGSTGHLWFPTSEALAAWLAEHPIRDAVILIKGSRGIQMEKTLPYL